MHPGTRPAPVHGARTCVFAPFSALTRAVSRTTRVTSTRPASSSRAALPRTGDPRHRHSTRSGTGGARSTSIFRRRTAVGAMRSHRPGCRRWPRTASHQACPAFRRPAAAPRWTRSQSLGDSARFKGDGLAHAACRRSRQRRSRRPGQGPRPLTSGPAHQERAEFWQTDKGIGGAPLGAPVRGRALAPGRQRGVVMARPAPVLLPSTPGRCRIRTAGG